jgi:hypothetical protein
VNPQRTTKALAAGLGIAGVLIGATACNPLPVNGGGSAQPSAAANGLCTKYLNPTMPASKGSQTPAVKVQLAGAKLASASTAKALTSAYTQFNNLTCTQYSHKYTESPPRFYYYDCVGFTGYTVRTSDPVAWNSLKKVTGLKTGYVPTPLRFETFMNELQTTAQPGWQAVAAIQDVKAGDIFAWQPTKNGVPTNGVGHSVIPLTTPKVIAGSNGLRWEVVVMDSTAGGHGPLDTRKPNNPLSQRNVPIKTSSGAVQASGLGIGTIAFDTTAEGQVTGIEWNVGNHPESIQFGAARPI